VENLGVTFDELLTVLREWEGRTVTMFDSLESDDGGLDDPITGTLYEGHAPAVRRPPDAPAYESTADTAQFTLWREPPVEESRWPVGKTYFVSRPHTRAKWDLGREGRALWISLAGTHTSLWVLEES
jgi:hypothetical protein